MAEEKDKRKRLNKPAQEAAAHRKKSKSASHSVGDKRSDHKHDYERCILENPIGNGFFWGGKCSICGRINEDNWLKAKGKKGLVKKVVKVKTFEIEVFYTLPELRQLYPGVTILGLNRESGAYEEISD